MDLTKLDVVAASDKGIPVTIKNPKTGEDTDLVITVKGMFSDQFAEELGKIAGVENSGQRSAEFLARFTLGWKNLKEGTKTVKFSTKEAERIYTKYPLVRGQLLEAQLKVGNFIKD